jgi:hypothetical protein
VIPVVEVLVRAGLSAVRQRLLVATGLVPVIWTLVGARILGGSSEALGRAA